MLALWICRVRAAAAELAGVELLQRLVHLEDGIDRAFHDARDIADDISHRHQVFVIEAFFDGAVLDFHEFAQRDQRGGGGAGFGQGIGIPGAHPQG